MAERRKIQRERIVAQVAYRSGWKSDQAFVYDLSTNGCMLEASAGFVEPGDTILVRFTSRVAVEGKVIWHERRNAGIEFAEPVHPLIVAHLTFREDKSELHGSYGRDQFGRPLLTSHQVKKPKRKGPPGDPTD